MKYAYRPFFCNYVLTQQSNSQLQNQHYYTNNNNMNTLEKQTTEHEILFTFIVINISFPSFCLYDAPMLVSV